MKKVERRDFLKWAAAAAGAGLLQRPGTRVRALQPTVAASDTVRVGIIGAGSRGKHMMRRFLRVPGVRFAAICDIYEPRFAEARKITGEDTPVYDDYRRMLENAELDAVLVTTPLYLHSEHMTAGLERGLHVYGEKAMGFTVEDNHRIVKAAAESPGLFQVGYQYRYAYWYREAVERIHSGEIGRVTHIHAYWHRNYNWRRPLPSPELERLINWRL